MAQKGRKKPSGRESARKEAEEPASREVPPAEAGAGSADWTPAEGREGPEDGFLDLDPAAEDQASGPAFPRREKTQPPLGDEDSGFEEAFGLEKGMVHIVDREDMGKGVQDDPDAYAQGPGKPGLVAGSTPPDEPGQGFLDPAARAGQGRASAEDVLLSRGRVDVPDWAGAGGPSDPDPDLKDPLSGHLSGSGFLDALLLDHPFPATKESLACALAQEAWQRGGPAEAFHDLVVQLDQGLFQDLKDLKRALGDRFMWESTHGQRHSHHGGSHGR
jgi:hypothetical protein